MSGINDSNTTDAYDNALVGVMGGTDNSRIGNVGDRYKVDSDTSAISYFSKKVTYLDATLARESVIPLTTWTSFYSYTGSGQLIGFLANLEGASGAEGARWYIRMVIDGTFYPFGTNGILISDITDANLYNIGAIVGNFCAVEFNGNAFHYDVMTNPIRFSTSISLEVYRISSTKKFRAGLVVLIKD
jgi:hypothetical protein